MQFVALFFLLLLTWKINPLLEVPVRTPLIAGNWKMNGNRELIQPMVDALRSLSTTAHMVICPPFPLLGVSADALQESPVMLGAQNVHEEVSGAYTGEVAVSMLKECGVSYCIVGHSERRQYFQEDNALIHKKIKRLLQSAIHPIYCVGETLQEREAGEQEAIVSSQITTGLSDIALDDLRRCVIAYEPVWAIGTGHTATPEQANDMHRHIRGLISALASADVAEQMQILYGGSVKPNNAKELLAMSDIDGALVGGASLKPEDFAAIVQAA